MHPFSTNFWWVFHGFWLRKLQTMKIPKHGFTGWWWRWYLFFLYLVIQAWFTWWFPRVSFSSSPLIFLEIFVPLLVLALPALLRLRISDYTNSLTLPLLSEKGPSTPPPSLQMQKISSPLKRDIQDNITLYPHNVIKEATHNFSSRFHLGGLVYRCKIQGKDVAVKRLTTRIVRPIQKLCHDNIVELIGASYAPEEPSKCYLIYQYMPNRSLEEWIKERMEMGNGRKGLTWRQRLQIAVDVVNGLLHIHTNGSAHMNLKPGNVLLDQNLRAKLGDFLGLSQKGTDHHREQDICALGKLLLGLLFGKNAEAVDAQLGNLFGGQEREEAVRNWVDPFLQKTYHIDSVLSTVMVAKSCMNVKKEMGEQERLLFLDWVAQRLTRLLQVCFEYHEC